MRIWHEQLIPHLCRQHLLVVWREGLGVYAILTQDKTGYRNHPAVKEFENSPCLLWVRLYMIRGEMLRRKYNPKRLPPAICECTSITHTDPWQTLEQQVEVLRSKGCDCDLSSFD